MKTAVLCINYSDLIQHSQINPLKAGIYSFELGDVPADAFHFIGRNICDTKSPNGLFHDIARQVPQILGYVTVENENGDFLTYSRGKSGGESRLNDMRSIGVGGHTDIEDVELLANGFIDAIGTLQRSVERELTEEIGLISYPDLSGTQLALVDLTDDASSVHIGIWIHVKVQASQVMSTKETQDLLWYSREYLCDNIDSYEPWSKLIIEKIQDVNMPVVR